MTLRKDAVEHNIGKKFNHLLILSMGERASDGKKTFIVQCDCGTIKQIRANAVLSGKTVSCGCFAKAKAREHIYKNVLPKVKKKKLKYDLRGKRFGRLLVTKRAPNKNGRVAWHCVCDCGNHIVTLSQHLLSGQTKSCGCYNRELAGKRLHDMNKADYDTSTRLYQTWKNMKSRCSSSAKGISRKRYFERGITVCDSWKNSYTEFMNWAYANGYRDDLTIDRIDNDGNYEPSNCRWVNRVVQANNMSTNHLVKYRNQTHTIAEWARILNLSYDTIKYRVNRKLSIYTGKPIKR